MGIKFELPSDIDVLEVGSSFILDGYNFDLSVGALNGQVLKYDGNSFIAETPTINGLLTAYENASSVSQNILGLTSALGPVLIRDNATPLGSTLFGVQDATGSTKYLDVTASVVTTPVPITLFDPTSGYQSPAITFNNSATNTEWSISEFGTSLRINTTSTTSAPMYVGGGSGVIALEIDAGRNMSFPARFTVYGYAPDVRQIINLSTNQTGDALRVVSGSGSILARIDAYGIFTTPTATIQNSDAYGYDQIKFNDNLSTNQGAIGYGNSSSTNAALKNLNYFYTPTGGADWVFSNDINQRARMFMGTGNFDLGTATVDPGIKFRIETASTSAGIELGAGNSLSVSSTNTGRIRFNSSTQHFEISENGGSYFQVLSSASGGGGGTFATTYSTTTPANNTMNINATGGPIITQFPASAAITNTITDALLIQNLNTAVVNTSGDNGQVYSPAIHFLGSGFKTNATASAETVEWRQYLKPAQFGAAPNNSLQFDSRINGGSWVQTFRMFNSYANGGIFNTLPGIQIGNSDVYLLSNGGTAYLSGGIENNGGLIMMSGASISTPSQPNGAAVTCMTLYTTSNGKTGLYVRDGALSTGGNVVGSAVLQLDTGTSGSLDNNGTALYYAVKSRADKTSELCEAEDLTTSTSTAAINVGDIVVWAGSKQIAKASAAANLTSIAGVALTAITAGTSATCKVARRGRVYANADAGITVPSLLGTSGTTAGNVSASTPGAGAIIGRACEATGGTITGQVLIDLILG